MVTVIVIKKNKITNYYYWPSKGAAKLKHWLPGVANAVSGITVK
jgi:hypothetical protein